MVDGQSKGRYWTEGRILAALAEFAREFGLPLTSTRYRRERKGQPFKYPSHEIIRRTCTDPWKVLRQRIEAELLARERREEGE